MQSLLGHLCLEGFTAEHLVLVAVTSITARVPIPIATLEQFLELAVYTTQKPQFTKTSKKITTLHSTASKVYLKTPQTARVHFNKQCSSQPLSMYRSSWSSRLSGLKFEPPHLVKRLLGIYGRDDERVAEFWMWRSVSS